MYSDNVVIIERGSL